MVYCSVVVKALHTFLLSKHLNKTFVCMNANWMTLPISRRMPCIFSLSSMVVGTFRRFILFYCVIFVYVCRRAATNTFRILQIVANISSVFVFPHILTKWMIYPYEVYYCCPWIGEHFHFHALHQFHFFDVYRSRYVWTGGMQLVVIVVVLLDVVFIFTICIV